MGEEIRVVIEKDGKLILKVSGKEGPQCLILFEGNLPLQRTSSLLPEGMIRDLLRWVNAEKAEKVRELLWSILLRKDVGLATVAKVADVAVGLCEKDPITRNNIIRFLLDHSTPDKVVDSLFQYSMASGKRIPGVVFKRYAGLLKDQEYQQQKKYILEKILSTAKLDDKEVGQIFSDYMNSLNRFDLIRLMSSSNGSPSSLSGAKQEGAQRGFPLDLQQTVSPHHGIFRQRVSSLLPL